MNVKFFNDKITGVKVFTGAGVLGATFVSLGFSFPANLIWSISNPCLVWHNYRAGQKEQAFMFSIFACLAIFGVVREVFL
jgi:hypothetical protein